MANKETAEILESHGERWRSLKDYNGTALEEHKFVWNHTLRICTDICKYV